MSPLIERAAFVLSRQSVAALPLGELSRLLTESGTPTSRTVLRRALAGEPDRFRVLSPLRALAKGAVGAGTGTPPTGSAGRVSDQRACYSPPGWEADEIWVLPEPRSRRGTVEEDRPLFVRLRASLVGLGWAVDATSARDLSRWAGMVLEGERFRRAMPPDQRASSASA